MKLEQTKSLALKAELNFENTLVVARMQLLNFKTNLVRLLYWMIFPQLPQKAKMAY